MLARATPSTYTPTRIRRPSGFGSLPFLYCTRTILRQYRSQGNDRPGRSRAPRSSPRPNNAADDGEELGGLLADWDKKRAAKYDRQGHASTEQGQDQFGKIGFKVNGPSDITWKTFKSRLSQSSTPPGQKSDGDSYAPFAGWSGPSSDDVNTKTRKRIHRDASQVPFERPIAQAREDPYADLEGTTITPSEKKAFQQLFELSESSSNPAATSASTTASSEETQHNGPGKTRKKDSLDQQPEGPTRLQRPIPEFPEPLKKLRESSASRDQDTPPRSSKHKTRKLTVGEHRIENAKRWADQDVFEVKRLMRQANTDVEVWEILQSRILDRVLALELDGPRSPQKGKKKQGANKAASNSVEDDTKMKVEKGTTAVLEAPQSSQGGTSVSEEDGGDVEESLLPATQDETMEASLAAVEDQRTDTFLSAHPQPAPLSVAEMSLRHQGRAFPQHLRNVFRALTDLFPGSPLPLNLIPLVKSLGPSTATLGLSTELYDMHIQYHWQKYRDPLAIDAVLEEMDNNVYEFDSDTRSVLLEIMREIKSARSGRLGTVAQVLSSMDRMQTGYRKLSRWYGVMKTRSQDAALRKAQEIEALGMEEREEDERARQRERLRRESLSDATEHDREALDEPLEEEDVDKQGEQDPRPEAPPTT